MFQVFFLHYGTATLFSLRGEERDLAQHSFMPACLHTAELSKEWFAKYPFVSIEELSKLLANWQAKQLTDIEREREIEIEGERVGLEN